MTIDFAEHEPSATGSYVFPHSMILTAGQLRSLNSLLAGSTKGASYNSWFESRGGLDPQGTTIKIALAGNRPAPVRVIDLSVTARRCTEGISGTLFTYNTGAGVGNSGDSGVETADKLVLNLDSPAPAARDAARDSAVSDDYFDTHTISLSLGETQSIVVESRSTTVSCRFNLSITVVDGDGTVTETISDHGKPFVTAGNLPTSRYSTVYSGGPSLVSQPFTRVDPVTLAPL